MDSKFYEKSEMIFKNGVYISDALVSESGRIGSFAIVDLAYRARALLPLPVSNKIYSHSNIKRIVDIIERIPSETDTITTLYEDVFTNNAGVQSEQLAVKEKSDITFKKDTQPAMTIAHYVIASRQVLTDAELLANHLRTRLWQGIDAKLDHSILYGFGIGNQFTGLIYHDDVNDVGFLPPGTAVNDIPQAMIEQIRKAITACNEKECYNITTLVINPKDIETMQLAKGSDGKYLIPTGITTLFGTNIIATEKINQGDFVVGDFAQCSLYVSEEFTMRASESHADLFTKNGVALLGEERIAFVVEQPKAFCRGKLEV